MFDGIYWVTNQTVMGDNERNIHQLLSAQSMWTIHK